MGCCSRLCCVKVVAVVAGLAATSLLTVSIVILPWISISELLPTDVLHKQDTVRRDIRSVTSLPRHDSMEAGDESSGDVDDMLIYGHVTTWPGPDPEPEVPSTTFLKPAAKYPYGIVPPTDPPAPSHGAPTDPPSPSPRPPSTAAPRHKPTHLDQTTPPAAPTFNPTRPPLNLPTDPPTRYSTPVPRYRPPAQGALLRTGLQVGLWRVCLTRSYLEWRVRWEKVIYTEVPNTVWEGDDECWGTDPFFPPGPPPDDVILRVSTIIGLLYDYHFILSLAISLLLLVMAVLVTSGGMARNNAVILVGAVLYEFSALVLAICLMWFYRNINYVEPPWGPATQLHQAYFGHTEKKIEGPLPRPQIRHFYGLAFFVAIGAFVMINMAGAAGIATYRISASKTTPYNFIRREREAVKKANKQWLVTRL